MNRGLSYAEAMKYVGVKRRTFDEEWRPHLTAMRQGSCLVFDRFDLDALFDKFKSQAADGHGDDDGAERAANDEQNGTRNGRSITERGVTKWAKRHGASTPETTEPGRSTSGGASIDFATAASAALKKRNGG
ncbi:hypothetical protein ACA040_004373 [Xenophilus aerolatus]